MMTSDGIVNSFEVVARAIHTRQVDRARAGQSPMEEMWLPPRTYDAALAEAGKYQAPREYAAPELYGVKLRRLGT